MYGRKRYPCNCKVWMLVLAAILFCYTSPACCKPYRQEEIHQISDDNQDNNKTILQLTNKQPKHFAQLDTVVLDPSLNSQRKLLENNKDKSKTTTGDTILHESVIFKAIISNVDVLTLQEENSSNSNGIFSSSEIQQGLKKTNESSSSRTNERPSKAHLKWDGHVVAAPLKYDPYSSDFQSPKKVSDTISTSKMVLSLLTAAAALGSICLTVAIFQCCCRRKRTSDDEEDDDQIDIDQCNKEKAAAVKTKSIKPETSEKIQQKEKEDTITVTPTEQTITIDGEAVQKDSKEEKEEEEEQVSVKDKIKAFETQALKPFITDNVEQQHRTLIKRPLSFRVSADCSESENLSASTSLIMGQVFRKRADTEKCQRKEAPPAPVPAENTSKTDDYFGVISRETEVLKSYRRAAAPRKNRGTKALYRKTMPDLDSGGRPNMEISMSDWESTVESFHQTKGSPFVKKESKKKKPIPLPLPNQKPKEDETVDNKLEDETDRAKAETTSEESKMETGSEKHKSTRLSTGNDTTPEAAISNGDEEEEGETKIKEEMKEENNKEEEKEEKKGEVQKEKEEAQKEKREEEAQKVMEMDKEEIKSEKNVEKEELEEKKMKSDEKEQIEGKDKAGEEKNKGETMKEEEEEKLKEEEKKQRE